MSFKVVPFPWKDVMNEPAKKRLESEELDVIERTRPSAPVKPLKGGLDQEFAEVSHTATAAPGEVNKPPTQTFLFFASQKMASISPFGPLDPKDENLPEDDVYEAILEAEVEPMDENEPAR